MHLRDSFYQPKSGGRYLMWQDNKGNLSHFGWEAPSDPNFDPASHSYCVWFRKDFSSDEEMIKLWEKKFEESQNS